jgi:hypothetical protein
MPKPEIKFASSETTPLGIPRRADVLVEYPKLLITVEE